MGSLLRRRRPGVDGASQQRRRRRPWPTGAITAAFATTSVPDVSPGPFGSSELGTWPRKARGPKGPGVPYIDTHSCTLSYFVHPSFVHGTAMTTPRVADYSFVVVCGARTPGALRPSFFVSMNSSDGSDAIVRNRYRGLLPDEDKLCDYQCERTTGHMLAPQTLTSPEFRYGGFLYASAPHQARTFQSGPTEVPCRRLHGHGNVAVIRLRGATYIVPADDPASGSGAPLTPHVRAKASDRILRVTTPEQLKELEGACPLITALRLDNEVPREEADDRDTPRPTYAEMAEFTTTCGLSPDCRPVVEIDIAPTALRGASASPDEVALFFEEFLGEGEPEGLGDPPTTSSATTSSAACPTCANPLLRKAHRRSSPLCRLYGTRPRANKKQRCTAEVHVQTDAPAVW